MAYLDECTTLISAERIAERVAQIGKQITEDYAGKELIVACVLKGGFMFCADLVRQISMPLKLDFISASSYGSGSTSTGNVRIFKDLEMDIKGKDLLLVEDIVDSGTTIKTLRDMLLARDPASIKVCALLDKPDRRKADIEADYVCFAIPDEFVVGYGLDYDSRYRNLPDVMVLAPSEYL
ncbi:hypoxanthine phosphoribosyltransferase [Eubacteriales bacterium OttesenSCG-928-N14]|nr:hypoxanthine phosphoribosyltransferase [Eubacteriales bacterium OttesenSCG-928-N14]